MVCEEKIEELQNENERLKKDISEIEIMHRAEIDVLNKKIKELVESDLVKFEYVDSVKEAFADIISDLSPIEIAEKLISSTHFVESRLFDNHHERILSYCELREISKYLEVYCDFNETE